MLRVRHFLIVFYYFNKFLARRGLKMYYLFDAIPYLLVIMDIIKKY